VKGEGKRKDLLQELGGDNTKAPYHRLYPLTQATVWQNRAVQEVTNWGLCLQGAKSEERRNQERTRGGGTPFHIQIYIQKDSTLSEKPDETAEGNQSQNRPFVGFKRGGGRDPGKRDYSVQLLSPSKGQASPMLMVPDRRG